MKIIYDSAADLKNWLRIKNKYPENFTFTEFYPFDKNIFLIGENIELLKKTLSEQDIVTFTEQAKILEQEWKRVESKILNKIFEYFKKDLSVIDFTANLTTAYYMPYDERYNWFMIPTHKSISEQLRCIIHELFHLYQKEINPLLSYVEREKEVNLFLDELFDSL